MSKRCMSQNDVAGLLTTYSTRAAHCTNTEDLKDIIRRLKEELDLRRIKHSKDMYND